MVLLFDEQKASLGKMINLMPYIITEVSAVVVSLLTMYIQRSRDRRNDDATLSEKYQKIAKNEAEYRFELEKRLNIKINGLVDEIKTLKAARERDGEIIREYIKGSDILFGQIVKNGDTPEWIPPHRDRREDNKYKRFIKWD